jgi:hypothetical protein
MLLSALALFTGSAFAAEDVCEPVVDGIRFTCPAGWQVVDEDHPPKRITLGNFPRNPDKSLSTVTPVGKSTIEIIHMPNLYRNVADWIDATEHMASDHRETSESFHNKTEGQVSGRCFTSPPRALTVGDRTCIFMVSAVPLMIELHHTRNSTDIPALEALVGQMIESARAVRR